MHKIPSKCALHSSAKIHSVYTCARFQSSHPGMQGVAALLLGSIYLWPWKAEMATDLHASLVPHTQYGPLFNSQRVSVTPEPRTYCHASAHIHRPSTDGVQNLNLAQASPPPPFFPHQSPPPKLAANKEYTLLFWVAPPTNRGAKHSPRVLKRVTM